MNAVGPDRGKWSATESRGVPTNQGNPHAHPNPDSIGTIVVGVDGADSSIDALSWGCDLASRIARRSRP